MLRARVGFSGDHDGTSDLVGVSTQASDLPGESCQAGFELSCDAGSDPRLLSEPSAYLGFWLRVLVLRRTFFGVFFGVFFDVFFGVGPELATGVTALLVFLGVC